ncbi:hypothetical protein [Psychrobacillus soli]|uniref:Uncharacterized protein n=1 Tax=Psychrobacillus soli TaxID=1543965 RepID=A0A544TGG8_9BACI|nr:hypothetical protein [Psychrobacillus soli]TQR16507.1 hypothetical protein FG383_06115 [Psychrobacillus soli]
MIEVITIVNFVIEVANAKDYPKNVENALQSNTPMIQYIETVSISSINEYMKVNASAKYRVLIEERKDNKFLDDYVGLVLPMFYNRFNGMPVSNLIYKISRIER